MRWLLLVIPLCLACQRQEAIATTDQEHQETDTLEGPYENCICNEIHVLNEKVDKLLDLLKCLCVEEPK